jgi:hypothetical protein
MILERSISMTNPIAPLIAIPIEPAENGEAEAPRVYRLRKSFAVVQFEPSGKGRIVFLPEGAELWVVGASRMSQCSEVRCKGELYNIFEANLLGPWSTRVKKRSNRPVPARSVAACA